MHRFKQWYVEIVSVLTALFAFVVEIWTLIITSEEHKGVALILSAMVIFFGAMLVLHHQISHAEAVPKKPNDKETAKRILECVDRDAPADVIVEQLRHIRGGER